MTFRTVHLENAVRVLAENGLLENRNFHILFSTCIAEARSFLAPVLAEYAHVNATGTILIPHPSRELTADRDLSVHKMIEANSEHYLPFSKRHSKLMWRGKDEPQWWDC